MKTIKELSRRVWIDDTNYNQDRGYEQALKHVLELIDEWYSKHYGEELKNKQYGELKARIEGEKN